MDLGFRVEVINLQLQANLRDPREVTSVNLQNEFQGVKCHRVLKRGQLLNFPTSE
jgi:hypothetical protein